VDGDGVPLAVLVRAEHLDAVGPDRRRARADDAARRAVDPEHRVRAPVEPDLRRGDPQRPRWAEVGPERGEPEDPALAVPDRKGHAGAELSVRAPPDRPGGEPRLDDLRVGVAESAEVLDQHVRADRGVADAELAQRLLLQPVLGEGVAGGPAALRVP
jgi:hypothetical protein